MDRQSSDELLAKGLTDHFDDSRVTSSNASVPSSSSIERRLDFLFTQSKRPGLEPNVSETTITGANPANFQNLRIGSYVIDSPIGTGAFGVVFRAHHYENESPVAIKVPRGDLLPDPDSLRRFQSEAKAGLQLDHPSIVQTLEADFTGPIPYIASEFCEGPDLARWLEHQAVARSDPRSIAAFVLQLCNAIRYAHRHGIIHRDIKPGNVMLTGAGDTAIRPLEEYTPKLTDFGLAKLVIDPIVNSRSSLVIGTPMYMAPEQLLPHWGPVTYRTDIYSLGVLLAELLTGKPPRFGMSYGQVLGSLLSNSTLDESKLIDRRVPDGLKRIARQCLQRDPEDRFGSAEELSKDLQAFLDGKQVSAKVDRSIHRLLTWARHPGRPLDICYFILPLNFALFLWMMLSTIMSAGSAYSGNNRWNDLTMFVSIAFANNFTTAGLTVLRLRGHRWASMVSLVNVLIIMVVVPILLLGGLLPNIMTIYDNQPYFSLTNHMLILLFGLVQVFLISVSIYADKATEQRSTRN
jgi:eukaryotic-like serine/threonine-protein kinase